ncbi:hypothetical protein C9J48_19560 [Photobacterium profundum]|uniref:Uncharacterized protein n=1 Tax=Photobacterium profundum 3TCK TaxID=314280 RepID=Q1Z1N7_9GAMM|nr:hypothetical protein P3TCK_24220 [Photobacterium profundum 3TCK]PSV60370.1 hypothetical protein C9J48_19560 [Photobacterium profundum]
MLPEYIKIRKVTAQDSIPRLRYQTDSFSLFGVIHTFRTVLDKYRRSREIYQINLTAMSAMVKRGGEGLRFNIAPREKLEAR